jgi:hypothetical protein
MSTAAVAMVPAAMRTPRDRTCQVTITNSPKYSATAAAVCPEK